MKVINSRKFNNGFAFFKDPVTNKYSGFSGPAQIYDKKQFVDTSDGTGYSWVIENLNPMINKLANRYYFSGNSIEDTRQDIVVHILEGISKYDPRRKTKLSSFMEMRINRRMINNIRDLSKSSKNANFLNSDIYNVKCMCGNTFITVIDNYCDKKCDQCKKPVTQIKNKNLVHLSEISEIRCRFYADENKSDFQINYFDVYDSNSPVLFKKEKRIDEDFIFNYDVSKWLDKEDPKIAKVIKLIYFDDLSVSAAAKKVGISGQGASLKLKSLSKNRKVKEIFNR